MSELLVAEAVVAGYLPGIDILNGVALSLAQGELVGVVGPNGAGKSTLLKAMFGLVPLRSGTVLLDRVEITGLAPHHLVAMGVGYVPQRENVFPSLTVDENLRMGAYLQADLMDERRGHVISLFPALERHADTRAGNLSGGERQMVAMARALMMQPDVLLLDEPSAGLSPLNQEIVFERVREIADAGVSIIMVEQNAHRCLQLCDRGYVLDQGANAYTGTGADLLEDPNVIALYLGTLGRN